MICTYYSHYLGFEKITDLPGVIYERHYALNWMIRYGEQEWDDVSFDT